MKKRIFGLMLALCLCLTLLPSVALAETGTTYYLYQHSGNIYCLATPATGEGSFQDSDKLSPSEGFYTLSGTGIYQLQDDITLDAPLRITGTITLDLYGHVLQYTGGSVIQVGDEDDAGNLTLTDTNTAPSPHYFTVNETTGLWTLVGGNPAGAEQVNGGIITGGTGGHSEYGKDGGGVFVGKGSFTMSGGNIVGCSAEGAGGGVYVRDYASFTMTGGSITGCTATHTIFSGGDGGGVYVSNKTSFTMTGGSITDCTADHGGGVSISVFGSFTMSDNAKIENCAARDAGGGVYLENGANSTTMSGGTIRNCTAGSSGGGVWVGNTSFTMSGGNITGCTATGTEGKGGGVCVYYMGLFNMNGGTIDGGNVGNTSIINAVQGGGVFISEYGGFAMQGGTIQNCKVSGKGGGVFVPADKTLTVGGGASGSLTNVTVASNTRSTGGDSTPDNVYLADSTAKITTAAGGLKAESDIRVTHWDDVNAQNLRYVGDLDLSSDAVNDQSNKNVSEASSNPNYGYYYWDSGEKTLTLKNCILDTLQLPANVDVTIKTEGNTLVSSILSCSGGPPTETSNALIFDGGSLTVGSIMWTHNASETGNGNRLVLKNGCTVTATGESGLYAGGYEIQDTAKLVLAGAPISSNVQSAISGLTKYIENSADYSAKPETEGNPTHYLYQGDTKVTNLTLYLIPTDDLAWLTPVLGALDKEPFDDVKSGDWFYDDVQYAYETGLMTGTASRTFSPDAPVTRGMVMTILARREGIMTDRYSPWYATPSHIRKPLVRAACHCDNQI